MTCFSAAAFVLSWTISSLSLLKLRKDMPHVERPYKLATPVAWWAAIVGLIFFVTMLLPLFPHFVGKTALLAFVGFLVIGVILYAVAGGQRKQISAHDRMKNMFGDLDLDAMRQK